eukprot:Gb_18011 [translate_table: standard]
MEKISKLLIRRLMWAGLILTALLLLFSSIHSEICCNAGRGITPHQHPYRQQEVCEANAQPNGREKQRKKLWASRNWKQKVDSFTAIFKDIWEEGSLSLHSKAMCISAGVGQEVMALRQMGLDDALGIEVVESPPLVIRGDPHNHPFPANTFDLEFSTHISEALFPTRFVSEMERTLKPGGLAVIVIPSSPLDPIIALFNASQLLNKKNVSLFGQACTEMVFRKDP